MNAVLFDLDGTLLPMSEEAFTGVYFKELTRAVAPLGLEPEALISAIWAGTKAMMKNDGAVPNCDRFWARFAELIPCDIERTRQACDAFYGGEFDRVREAMGPAPLSAKTVKGLIAKGYRVVLATNPIFPMVAVETRLRWIGLRLDDFEWITSYENSRFCKPNPRYYESILERLGCAAADCLMVGNNATEDMCFAQLGGAVYLVTDHLENPKGVDIAPFPRGSFEELAAYLEALPEIR